MQLLNSIVTQINDTHPMFKFTQFEEAVRNSSYCPPDQLNWNFYNSLFFSFTAITTIGKEKVGACKTQSMHRMRSESAIIFIGAIFPLDLKNLFWFIHEDAVCLRLTDKST